jgi:hypothetical protein
VVGATTGVVPAPKGYFKGTYPSLILIFINLTSHIAAMKTVCDKFGALFILDEVGVAIFFFPQISF